MIVFWYQMFEAEWEANLQSKEILCSIKSASNIKVLRNKKKKFYITFKV